MLKKVFLILGAVAVGIGLWGVYIRLTAGHSEANYGSYVVWGLWVAMYMFFAGVAAGSFMLATLDLLFNIKVFKGTGNIALVGSLATLSAALLCVWLDLGHMERIWKVYLQGNLSSIMFQIVWGYTLFGLSIVAALYLSIRRKQSVWLKVVMVIGLVLSIYVSGAVGALLGVQAARPFWHVGLFPVQFPVFSLASGAAMMLVLLGFVAPKDDPNRRQQLWILSILSAVLLIIKLYFLWADYSQSYYGGVPMNVEAVNTVLLGKYWWAFWILQILIGSIIPLIVLVQPRLAKQTKVAGWMGVLLLIGYAIARGLIIYPAQTVPELALLAQAFTGPHLTFLYFPSVMEWAVAIGAVGLATLAVLLGNEYLPLYSQTAEEA
jgi:molybdopterin-containing oxidoreductase family membrane subunit